MHTSKTATLHMAADSVHAPTAVELALSLTIGMLAGIIFGLIHRADSPPAMPLFTPPPYSVAEAIMRAGKAFLGAGTLTLACLLISPAEVSLLILLTAAVIAVTYGVLARIAGATWQAAAWRAAKTLTSVAAACHTVLALYLQG